jgi:aerobic-type carbon monoxide dehydrogenase small subunit (CoxS/CutS family)
MAEHRRRINRCPTLAVMHDGEGVTPIEGLGPSEDLAPMPAAFVKHDGFECGYRTPGQIYSVAPNRSHARWRAGFTKGDIR